MLFKDRTAAGQLLARRLFNYASGSNRLVLALPHGGVPVAFEVAKALNAPLDVFLRRKLGVPEHEKLAMGAIASGEVRIVNNDILEGYHHSEAAIDKVAAQEQQDLERQERLYRDNYSAPAIRGRLFPNDHRESV